MSLIQILLQPIFHLLYHQFAWTYDFVAAFVSLGRWQDWVDAVVPFMSGRVLEIGFGPGHLQELLNKQNFPVFGVDESSQMAQKANKLLGKKKAAQKDHSRLCAEAPFSERSVSICSSNLPNRVYFRSPNIK